MKTVLKYLFVPFYLAAHQFFLTTYEDSAFEKWIERPSSNVKKHVRFGIAFVSSILAGFAHLIAYVYLIIFAVMYLWIVLLGLAAVLTPVFIYWVVRD